MFSSGLFAHFVILVFLFLITLCTYTVSLILCLPFSQNFAEQDPQLSKKGGSVVCMLYEFSHVEMFYSIFMLSQ